MNLEMQIFAMVMTVIQEAANELYIGKLAVAYVIENSCGYWGRSITDEVFKRNRYSCWRDDSPTTLNLDLATDALVAECLKACLAAHWHLELDPTNGAVFYLNPKTVIAQAGRLPDWWDIDGDPSSEVVIHNHTFRRHRGMKQTVVV